MASSLKTRAMVGLVSLSFGLIGCGAAADDPMGEDPSVSSDEVTKGGGGSGGGGPKPPAKIEALALGDSIAFGFSPLVTTPTNPKSYIGYPEAIANTAAANMSVTNASCPGETSGSLLSPTAADNGCRQWKAAYSLHADYETPQIDFAESFLRGHSGTKYVSIDIGANDLLLVQKNCAGAPACIQAALPGALTSFGQNLGATYTRLRAAGFKGKFVALTLYATNYNDPLAVPAITALNQTMASVTTSAGGVVADGFAAFQTAATTFAGDACAAGLLIKLADGTCDIHPSPKGRDILAVAVVAAAR